ncbi:MAG: ATP-dependent RecD-like DNA helicase [Erysipelotrichaceae bacterium]|nr:ATP-dependent RecD-like DNA helicase [Erysipelotrichaceae bacterium]
MQEIQGKFQTIIFHNEQTLYTVAKFKLYEVEEKDITVTGNIAPVSKDILYRLYGEYIDHPKYGYQFHIEKVEKVLPTDSKSQVTFLSSPLFPGIGVKLAQRIIDELGDNAIDQILADPSVLDPIKGMSAKKKEVLISGLSTNNNLEASIRFFTTHGLGIRNIMKLDRFYGSKVLDIVQQNPYQLVEDITGIGFAISEKLAMSMDFDMFSEYRSKAALYSLVMEECMSRGDTYVLQEELLPLLIKKVGHQEFHIDDLFDQLEKNGKIYREQNRVYHASQYEAEIHIANFLVDFLKQADLDLPQEDLHYFIQEIEQREAITYDDIQKEAIQQFIRKPFLILSGGPGTGKTTIVKAMLSLYHKLYPHKIIALCAPTGRAAKRLSELTGVEATTIHRLLKWDLEANEFGMNEDNPIIADLLVIDEFSMVDPWLLHNIFKASDHITKILFIGDENQLPSVACGCVLRDLLQSNLFPTIQLQKIYRQNEGSDVVTLAHQIKQDENIELEHMNDVKFYEMPPHEVRAFLLKLVDIAVQKGYDINSVQVLAPKYNGTTGIDALNRELQKLCNPVDETKRELNVGYRTFREGDKILQLKNQPEDDVYNGDIGILEEIVYAEENEDHKNLIVVNYDGNLVFYTPDLFVNITHAYCISIHKSQGNEYPIVIMPLLKEYYYMLSKKLLYTGITRARKSLILLGESDMLAHGIKHLDRERQTTLKERIVAKFKSSMHEFF